MVVAPREDIAAARAAPVPRAAACARRLPGCAVAAYACSPAAEREGTIAAMGRWRAPAAHAAPYITAAGYRALEAEVKALWARRLEVVRHLAAAAAEGDRSENAEYIYRKKELRELDRRLGYLQRRMPRLEVVRARPADHAKVYFGATVELEDASGAVHSVRLVGADEADAGSGSISLDAPLARCLLGRALDDEVSLAADGGAIRYTIIGISYAHDV